MKHLHAGILLFGLLLNFFALTAQVTFKAVVPQRPMAPGESFQIQYIIENAENISDFSPPSFQGFRLVSGPHIYSGDGDIAQKNLVFTLAALREGNFKIPGASCMADGKFEKSNDVYVTIMSEKDIAEDSYFLKQGEDPLKKIRENLFLKLTLDRSSCFVGEPLVATFRLYSRLQSKSNIVKNPGFYGFSVYDMINVNDQVKGEEKVNGHWFDVHTILKVQLYPLQSGVFTIDPMELANEVEFSRSIVSKKTEQEVTENMYGIKADGDENKNAEVYELNIRTEPVTVRVRPLPVKNAADTFAGAVGNFSIKAFVEKDSISKNEEDSLVIAISGAGNFQRVGSPVVNWPKGIEFFDPILGDTLNKQQVPLTGERRFSYTFLSDKPGHYIIPPVSFSFFDLDTKSYKTVSSKPLTVFIKDEFRKEQPIVVSKSVRQASHLKWWWVAGSLVVLSIGIFIWVQRQKNRRIGNGELNNLDATTPAPATVEEILLPAYSALNKGNAIFCEVLNRAIWNYFEDRLADFNVNMNKSGLATILDRRGVSGELINEIMSLIRQCETGIYTSAEMNVSTPELFDNARATLMSIDQTLAD